MASLPTQAKGIHCSAPVNRPILKSLLSAAFLAWCAFPVGGVAQASTPTATGEGAPAGPSAEQLERLNCPDSLYRILPGAFDYCVATRHWTRGRYGEGVDMLQRAAALGNKDAQLALGVAYFNGDHVATNRPLGLAWLGLAAERKEARPLQLLHSAYGKASSEERRQAQVLMEAMWPTYADYHAAVKADTIYRRAIRAIGERSIYGDGICIDGITGSPIVGMSTGAVAETVGCPAIATVIRTLDTIYAGSMRGWNGTVTVGKMIEARTTHLHMDSDESKP